MKSKYIALLRGINVGGKNPLSMPALKAVFEKASFTEVQTYINSGNIIFSSQKEGAFELQKTCKKLIQKNFGLDIPVMVISAVEYTASLKKAPSWWGKDSESRHDCFFVILPNAAADIFAQVGKPNEYEKIASSGQFIFWSCPRKTFSRTRWSKIISLPAYGCVTIRNRNTTCRLAEMVRGEENRHV